MDSDIIICIVVLGISSGAFLVAMVRLWRL